VAELVAAHIHQARAQIAQRRQEIREMHANGATGAQVVAAQTVLVDGIVARLAQVAAEELGPDVTAAYDSSIALVALGGYGRAELAPFSDVDLMFLYMPQAQSAALKLCDRLVRDFWDARLTLGWSVRTPGESASLASGDVSIHTALLEARHVVGSPELTDDLRRRLSGLTRGGRRCNTFVAAAAAERAAEAAKGGSSVHLLEPDLKKSRGGLRELHLLRWVAWAKHGAASIDRLERDGHLSSEDAAALVAARAFLLRARNELHFHADRAQDMLAWDEQVRLAAFFGFQDRPGMRAVEQFMQQYYRHSAAIDDVVDRFVGRSLDPSSWRRLVDRATAKRVAGDFVVCGGKIAPRPGALPRTLGSLDAVVRIFELANACGVVVADSVREQIRSASVRSDDDDLAAARRRLHSLLARPGHLGPNLRHMHALGVLEKLIPEFVHAHGLIQYNQYHKYTVDEHTLLCVANVERLEKDSGPLGQVYNEVRHKELVHLALLLHDLGKGFEEDHSELGRRIALDTADRFALEAHDRDVLVFLVHQHLLMAHLAFRRDISDEKLLTRFARQVGTPEVLRMLFVLTAADVMSVGPEAWTSWKAELLTDLYARTMEKLSPDVPTLNIDQRVQELRTRVRAALSADVPDEWLQPHLGTMTTSYLLTTPVGQIVEHLRNIRTLAPKEATTTAQFDAETAVTAYTVYTWDNITPGLFSKIAGVLAAKGLQILSAQISTFTDGVVVDRFEVIDYDYNGEPPRTRLADVGGTIRAVLLGEQSIEGVFARSVRIGSRFQLPTSTLLEPTQVKVDNDTSDRFTILEVFANDRQGLLYVITRTIFELGLSVSVAKIATSLDQVLDVFYVTDQAGQKVTDTARVVYIQDYLARSIEAFERCSHTAGVA
jgi:[protein-PII] uridylyltransferase